LKDNILETLKSYIDKNADRFIKFREHLHANPELSQKEEKTHEFILSNIVKKEYIEIVKFDDTYGFWVDVNFKDKAVDGGVIALRADMDALPIEEETGAAFCSKNKGVMHACGHDTHTAMLFGALCAVTENYDMVKKHIKAGAVRFIFQASEEMAPGGALPLVEKGVLKDVKYIFGQHVMPGLLSGKAGFRDGGVMAAVDEFEIEFSGRGGHAAKPDESHDLLLLAAELIVSAQKIVSRNISPLAAGVISFCMLNAGTARNILPAKLSLAGTVRSLDPVLREYLPKRLEQLIKLKCEEFGAGYKIEWINSYPVTVNDPGASAIYKKAAAKILGKENIIDPVTQSMGAEDFAYYAEKVPGAFAFFGTGKEGDNFPLHHPKFSVENKDIINGIKLFTAVICEFTEIGE